MSIWLDTRGKTVISVAICDRCHLKKSYVDMVSDPNSPGLRVCKDCKDIFDPWRLPARQTEDISIQHPRPDVLLDGY
jgi:hypothetical protein